MSTRIRVKEMKMVPASLLEPHPGNFRMHTPEQRNAMDGVLSEVGFAGAVLVRELEGGRYQVLDGHLRVEEMQGEEVPVLVTDLSEMEARKVLATFDAVGKMAEVDVEGLKALVEGIEWDQRDVEKLITETIGETAAEKIAAEGDEGPVVIPEMELQPLEHYDYVVVLARTRQDWNRLSELLGLERVKKSRSKRIGLGRGINAERLIELLERPA